MMTYLIQGFFWQRETRLSTGINHEGSTTLFKKAMYRTMYAGIIYPDPNNEMIMIGKMIEEGECGKSVLSEIDLSPEKISFVKKYEGWNNIIKYELARRENGIWVGTYKEKEKEEGYTSCLLTKVSKDFTGYHPEEI